MCLNNTRLTSIGIDYNGGVSYLVYYFSCSLYYILKALTGVVYDLFLQISLFMCIVSS